MQGFPITAINAIVKVGEITAKAEVVWMCRLHHDVVDWKHRTIRGPGYATLLYGLQQAKQLIEQSSGEIRRAPISRGGQCNP